MCSSLDVMNLADKWIVNNSHHKKLRQEGNGYLWNYTHVLECMQNQIFFPSLDYFINHDASSLRIANLRFQLYKAKSIINIHIPIKRAMKQVSTKLVPHLQLHRQHRYLQKEASAVVSSVTILRSAIDASVMFSLERA